ncbi:hypothetical protein Tco_0561397 [Tanacetum coccineum]
MVRRFGGWRRVARGVVDRIDRVKESIFGVRRKNSPANFSGGGGGGRRRLGGGRPWLWWPDFMKGKSPAKQDYGCKYFIWKDDLDLQLRISSSPGPSTPRGSSQGFSIHPSSSSGPSEYAPIECLNCKVKDLKIKMFEARLEMERNPEDHACQSAVILHELLNEM